MLTLSTLPGAVSQGARLVTHTVQAARLKPDCTSFPQREQRAPSGPSTPGARGPALRASSPRKRGPRASTGPPGLSSPHCWCCTLDSPAVFFTPDYSVQCQTHAASRWGDISDVTAPF